MAWILTISGPNQPPRRKLFNVKKSNEQLNKRTNETNEQFNKSVRTV